MVHTWNQKTKPRARDRAPYLRITTLKPSSCSSLSFLTTFLLYHFQSVALVGNCWPDLVLTRVPSWGNSRSWWVVCWIGVGRRSQTAGVLGTRASNTRCYFIM